MVADPKMVEYHGMKDVENYILAVMNIVSRPRTEMCRNYKDVEENLQFSPFLVHEDYGGIES